MAKVSIIIPSRNEIFLPQTVNDLITKAVGEIEVITVLDGYWPDPPLPNYSNLIILHRSVARGMRAAINDAAAIAKGEYLMKCDAHCMFAEGYDAVLKADCDDNWVVIPSRYSLDAENWTIIDKARVDYHYLSCPTDEDFTIHGRVWTDRAKQKLDPQYDIDDEMSSQGSCWFMKKNYFDNFLGGLHEEGYGTFTQEFQEIGMKTWLGGGAVKINKKVWYAHLHKSSRGYSQDRNEVSRGNEYSARFWIGNQWKERIHDFNWLIDKFWPVPSWKENYVYTIR